MLEKLKIMLGESVEQYQECELIIALKDAEIFILDYCNRDSLNDALEFQVMKLAVVGLNRKGTEGLASESYSGVSYTYQDIPDNILKVLNKNRQVRMYV